MLKISLRRHKKRPATLRQKATCDATEAPGPYEKTVSRASPRPKRYKIILALPSAQAQTHDILAVARRSGLWLSLLTTSMGKIVYKNCG